MYARIEKPNGLSETTNNSSYNEITDPIALKKLNGAKPGNDTWPYPNAPFAGGYPTDEQKRQSSKDLREGLQNTAQNFLNTPEEAANVFGKHIYNKFNFAPDTHAGKIGGEIGDMASYFLPSGLAKLGLKGVSIFPKAKKAIEAGANALNNMPIRKYLLNIAKNASEGALFQKEKFPQSSNTDVAKAGGYSAGIPMAISAFTNTNPMINFLTRAGLGGAVGYHEGGQQGALEGAGLALTAPHIAKEFGLTRQPVAAEFLKSGEQTNALAKSRYEAGQRIDSVPRPSEAFGSPGKAASEGVISKTDTGGQAMHDYGLARNVEHEKTINHLLDKIYPDTKESSNAIKTLYKKSYEANLGEEETNALLKKPTIAEAAKKVDSEAAYQEDLEGVKKNNFAYLDQVKRALNDMSEDAKGKNGKVTNKSRIYSNSANKLTDQMDAVSNDYKMARQESEKQITRDKIQRVMNKKQVNGRNFFTNFMANTNNYKDLMKSLRNAPEAQQQLEDMKLAWEHLIGTETPRAAAGAAARSMSAAREAVQGLWGRFKDLIGSPRDVERANFIHDPKWWDKFDDVIKYDKSTERNDRIGQLLGRNLNFGLLESSKADQEKK